MDGRHCGVSLRLPLHLCNPLPHDRLCYVTAVYCVECLILSPCVRCALSHCVFVQHFVRTLCTVHRSCPYLSP